MNFNNVSIETKIYSYCSHLEKNKTKYKNEKKKYDNLKHYFYFQVGDEIYQVNGYKVSDAVHRELTKYIASQDRITLRVRGM